MKHSPKEEFVKTLTALVAAIIMVLPVTANAQISVSMDLFNKYVVDPGFIAHDDQVVQADIFVVLPKGFSIDFWGSSGADFKPNFGREIDFTMGWSGKFVGCGLSFFDLHNVFSHKTADIVQPYVEVRSTFSNGNHSFNPFIKADYNLATRDQSKNSASDVMVGIKHGWQINQTFSVSQKFRLLYNDGLFGSKSGFITRWDIGMSARVTRQVNLNLSVRNSIPSGSLTDRQKATAVGVGISSSFPW